MVFRAGQRERSAAIRSPFPSYAASASLSAVSPAARNILHGALPPSEFFAPLKFVATFLSTISGIPGGLFAPSLATGAGLAGILHPYFPDVEIGALAVICMVSYLTGVLQTPITSFVIVSEMTQDHAMVIPLMLAALIADGASKLMCREGIYRALAERFLAQARQDIQYNQDIQDNKIGALRDDVLRRSAPNSNSAPKQEAP
jgi:H+/Cl- antiporter ClcA